MVRISKIPINYIETQDKSHLVAILKDDQGLPHLAVPDLDQHIPWPLYACVPLLPAIKLVGIVGFLNRDITINWTICMVCEYLEHW